MHHRSSGRFLRNRSRDPDQGRPRQSPLRRCGSVSILGWNTVARSAGAVALAPNRREPGLLMPRPPRRAVVMAHLHEPGRGDVIAPGVKIEETGIATIAQAFLVVPPRI